MGLRTGIRRTPALAMLIGMAWSLAACHSQPAKYRHSNDCKCPKWNYVPKPPSGTDHADAHPVASPYHCGAERRS